MGAGEARLILDTNALSAAADEHAGLVGMVAGLQELALPVIAIGEYRYGIEQSRHKARYRRWLDEFISDCLVLNITEETTHRYAAIYGELRQAGKPIPTNDMWIAALCREHEMPLLSRDRHFDVVAGIRRVEW